MSIQELGVEGCCQRCEKDFPQSALTLIRGVFYCHACAVKLSGSPAGIREQPL